ncbi:MAG: GerMN domain-containing protein [Acidimicrobiales bacterium]
MSRRLSLVLGILALVGTGCGVGTQRASQLLDRRSVPFGLLAPVSSTTTVVVQRGAQVTVYFEGQNGLVPVVRQVPAPATVKAALDQLAKGPTLAEAAGVLQSPVSTVAPPVVKRIHNGTAWVSVPAGFADLGGQGQIVAAAQIVYTATSIAGITAVVLVVNGQPAQVPIAGGTLLQGPLTRADYAVLAGQ